MSTTQTGAATRPARAADVERLAELATQLGYRTRPDELAARLPAVQSRADTALIVAEDTDGGAIGWIHVELKHSLLSPPAAQVLGLVVADGHRGRGVGAELLGQAEAWAVTHGCGLLLVGTRVTREDAHRFYRRQGYRLLKTSHLFAKELE